MPPVGDDGSRLQQTQAQVAAVRRQVATLELERRIVGELTEGVHFATGSDRLTDEARMGLSAFVDGLRDLAYLNFYLAGYTDVRGASRYNYELGERRATRPTGGRAELGRRREPPATARSLLALMTSLLCYSCGLGSNHLEQHRIE